MLTANAILLKLTHRPARDDFKESWIARFLLESDEVLDAGVNDQQVADTLGKLARRSPVAVQFTARDTTAYLAYRLTVTAVAKGAPQ